MNEHFGFQISDATTIRELYLMIRSLPRHYKFKCDCEVVHTQSSLQMHAECEKCGYGEKLFHFASGEEIHDVLAWSLRWLGIPADKLDQLNLHPDDHEKEIDWSASDRYFKITPEEIQACRIENIRELGDY